MLSTRIIILCTIRSVDCGFLEYYPGSVKESYDRLIMFAKSKGKRVMGNMPCIYQLRTSKWQTLNHSYFLSFFTPINSK